ncbi:MAG: ATP-binding cassette domain-containing protein [Bacteroidota bacterium]
MNLNILPKDKIVITGNNGSGKSTLLKIIAGLISPNNGQVKYYCGDRIIEKEKWHQYVSVAAPYMNLIDDFTVTEIIKHIRIFREFHCDEKTMLDILQLNNHLYKPIKQFSSGMKQRVRLLLAIMDKAPVLLLDEPCSNLDADGIKWYSDLINKVGANKTIIVFSNSQPQEYFFCDKFFDLSHQ